MRWEFSCWIIVAAIAAAGLAGAAVSAFLAARKKNVHTPLSFSSQMQYPCGERTGLSARREETSVLDVCRREEGAFVEGFSRTGAILIRRKTGERADIRRPLFLIGKDPYRADFCIPDNDAVSRIHAGIISKGDSYCLIDRNSTNGTWLNGRKLESGQEAMLEPGDRIRLADEELDFWL